MLFEEHEQHTDTVNPSNNWEDEEFCEENMEDDVVEREDNVQETQLSPKH